MGKPKEKKPEVGILFPEDGKGGRSTQTAGKKIIAAALRGSTLSTDSVEAGKCEKERNWRFAYNKHFMKHVTSSCKSAEAAKSGAKLGLDYIYDNFQFVRKAGDKPIPFKEELANNKGTFKTGRFEGTASKKGIELLVPFNGGYTAANTKPPGNDDMLKGVALKEQLTKWAELGVVEPDAAQAISYVADYLAEGKTLSDCHFVLIGAGSAMGPFSKLLELGANVIALDIPGNWGGPRPSFKVWEKLIGTAKTSSGTITFPMSKEQKDCKTDQELYEACGANLMEQPAEIRNWLLSVVKGLPKNAKLVIGNYTYLDGDLHVKLALAADAIISGVRAQYPDTACAFLCTPTDIHVVPEAANKASLAHYSAPRIGFFFEWFFQVASLFKKLQKNALKPVKTDDKKIYLVDGLSVAQGPNYALAKRMQHWRAQLTFEEGAIASTRVAPSTATISVMHNKTFQWGYFGMPYFAPFEIFKQETTNAVMCALLVHDLINPKSSKNPKNRVANKMDNSLELFRTDSVHGGLWRCGYKLDTIGEFTVLVHFLGGPKMFPLVLVLGTVAFVYGVMHMFGLM